jgi:hypothetical protein
MPQSDYVTASQGSSAINPMRGTSRHVRIARGARKLADTNTSRRGLSDMVSARPDRRPCDPSSQNRGERGATGTHVPSGEALLLVAVSREREPLRESSTSSRGAARGLRRTNGPKGRPPRSRDERVPSGNGHLSTLSQSQRPDLGRLAPSLVTVAARGPTMPRRSILSNAERATLLALPDTHDDLIR